MSINTEFLTSNFIHSLAMFFLVFYMVCSPALAEPYTPIKGLDLLGSFFQQRNFREKCTAFWTGAEKPIYTG